jgi:5-methylcytosine-specific restriction endonuclease McrA
MKGFIRIASEYNKQQRIMREQDRQREQKSKEEYKIWDCSRYNHCQDDDESCIECSIDNRKKYLK